MTVDVESVIVIDRPCDRVAAFAVDPDNATRWYSNIKLVTWQTDPPVAVGSRVAFTAQFLGRRLSYTYRVDQLVPGERLVMSTADGPFPMETTYLFEDVGDGRTEVRLRNRGRPAGFSRVVTPFLAIAMRRANRSDLRSLKRVLENSSG